MSKTPCNQLGGSCLLPPGSDRDSSWHGVMLTFELSGYNHCVSITSVFTGWLSTMVLFSARIFECSFRAGCTLQQSHVHMSPLHA